MWIIDAVRELQKHKVQFAIAGGYAVALHGAVRGTVDLDLVVTLTLENLEKLENASHALGLQSRIPVSAKDIFSFREEYIKNRNLIVWSFVHKNNPAKVIDVIITHNLKTMGTKSISIHGLKVPLVGIKSLISMKREAGRPQDLEDIKALEAIDEKS